LNDLAKNLLLWVVIAIVLMTVFNNFGPQTSNRQAVDYSDFISEVQQGRVQRVEIEDHTVQGVRMDGSQFTTQTPPDDPKMVDDLLSNNVEVKVVEPNQHGLLMSIFINWFPMLLLIGVWIFFMRQMQGGGGARGAMSFGKSKARMLGEDQVKITFGDVAGIEEAKEEVSELVEFLAKVPFFTISGSDFVEMFVGVGASRVRDMFEQAKKHAPCIIFIDEIDAVGRHRGAGLGGGHDEREQTLNQLLVEMDGFEGNEGVIVIAATNRPDVLDPALLRPGRFDRQVVVPLPDVRGREQILKVHMRKVPLSDSVKASIIARATPGFSGADLANLVNEAALFAARGNKRLVDMEDLEKAKDKIMMGAERRSMVMTEDEKRLTAYHEAGHAIVGRSVPSHDPVYKVSIMPRGRALGVTMFLPEQDRYSQSKEFLEGNIASLFGGRIAEALVFGPEKVTTGASNDIMRSTELARNMVTKWGLSEKLGPLTYSEEQDEIFLGHSVAQHKAVSDETAHDIDSEIRVIIDRAYKRAENILKENLDKLHLMADALMKFETIDSDQIDDIMNGRPPRPPKDWSDIEPGTPPSGVPGTDGKSDEKSDGKIGGPAGQH
jgi:cell division protease FtsH